MVLLNAELECEDFPRPQCPLSVIDGKEKRKKKVKPRT